MRYRKSIAYCYPTSEHAKALGSGGFFIQQQVIREDGTWSPGYISPGTEGEVFNDPRSPDLQALLTETEGDICPMSLKYHPEYYK